MKLRFAVFCLLAGSAAGQGYSSYVAGTQIHAAANHWGNDNIAHHLIDSVTIPVAIQVSRASWAPYSSGGSSLINIYDAGLYCLSGQCQQGKLYTHTGPLLLSQVNPGTPMVSVPLVADTNTVCQSYPCTLPPGTYSLSTGTTETGDNSLSLWSDSGGVGPKSHGGAEYHIVNAFGEPDNAFVGAYATVVSYVLNGNREQVTLTATMLNAQNGQQSSFATGMRVMVAGLSPPQCEGIETLDSATAGVGGSVTLIYTFPTNTTLNCQLESDPNETQTCASFSGTNQVGVGCVSAGLLPQLSVLPVEQYSVGHPGMAGFYCYSDEPDNGDGTACLRSGQGFAGPAGPQTGAHSVGITIY